MNTTADQPQILWKTKSHIMVVISHICQ